MKAGIQIKASRLKLHRPCECTVLNSGHPLIYLYNESLTNHSFRTQKSFSRPYCTKNIFLFSKCRSNIFIMHLKNWYYPAVHQRQFSFTMKLRYISSKRSWEENLIKWRDSSHFQHLRSWRHFYDMADEAAAGCCLKLFRL